MCKHKAVKLIMLFDVHVDMMQISHFVNLANHDCCLAGVLYASSCLMPHQASLSLPKAQRERPCSCAVFQPHDEKAEGLPVVIVFSAMCACTSNNEDVAHPYEKTSLEDLTASELPRLRTDCLQPTARKIPAPFFPKQHHQK